MIVVTGATGKLGSRVARLLLARQGARASAVSARDPGKAAELRVAGVDVRQADYSDPASLPEAFAGASRVLLISSNSSGSQAVEHHTAAIEAAVRAGVQRIVYTSHMGASSDSLFPPMVDHAATERVLQGCGVPFTSLRNGFYADSAAMMLGPALRSGEVALPADGPVSWTAHDDLAEVAFQALTGDRLDGITPPWTGAEALDFEAVAAQVRGEPVKRTVTSDEAYQQLLVSRGLPTERAAMLLGVFLASRRGEFERVTDDLAQLLGRAPQGVREAVQ